MSKQDDAPASVLEARRLALEAVGGANAFARTLGRPSGEGVRRWYVNLHPTPEQARLLVDHAIAAGHKVGLQDILPGAYAGLSKRELGYTPK